MTLPPSRWNLAMGDREMNNIKVGIKGAKGNRKVCLNAAGAAIAADFTNHIYYKQLRPWVCKVCEAAGRGKWVDAVELYNIAQAATHGYTPDEDTARRSLMTAIGYAVECENLGETRKAA